jgi:hypothetical protein
VVGLGEPDGERSSRFAGQADLARQLFEEGIDQLQAERTRVTEIEAARDLASISSISLLHRKVHCFHVCKNTKVRTFLSLSPLTR